MVDLVLQGALRVPAVVALVLIGLRSAWRAYLHLGPKRARSTDDPEPLALVRGIRALIMTAGTLSAAAGILTGVKWLVLFGLVFIGEELLETGIMIAALRAERRGPDPARATGLPRGAPRGRRLEALETKHPAP